MQSPRSWSLPDYDEVDGCEFRQSDRLPSPALTCISISKTALPNTFTALPEVPLARLAGMPLLVAGQRLGGHYGHHIIRRRVFLKIHGHFHIAQMSRAERRSAGDPGQLGGAQGEQPLTIAQQQVTYPSRCIPGARIRQAIEEFGLTRLFGELSAQTIEQIAEDGFAVGVAHGLERTRASHETIDLAVVGTGPVLSPQLTGKRMGVGQADTPHIGLADMADHIFRFDRIALDQLGDGRTVAWRRVMEATNALALIEGHAPAITMGPRLAATLHQSGKAEADIRRHVGTHTHQFTHLTSPLPPDRRDHLGRTWYHR